LPSRLPRGGRLDSIVGERGQQLGAQPILAVLRVQLGIHSEQGAREITEFNVGRWTVVDGTNADIEQMIGQLGAFFGCPCPVQLRLVSEVLQTFDPDGNERIQHGGNQHLATTVGLIAARAGQIVLVGWKRD